MLPLMAVMDFLQKRRQEALQRNQQAAGILQSSAQHLGAPTYNVQAARELQARGEADRAGMMGAAGMPTGEGGGSRAALMEFLMSRGQEQPPPAGTGMAPELAQDYENNPAALRYPRTGGYGGGYGGY